MPDTVPASRMAHSARFHHELVQAARSTKKMVRVVTEVMMAMMADAAMLAGA